MTSPIPSPARAATGLITSLPRRLVAGGLVIAVVGTVVATRVTSATPPVEYRTAPVTRANVTQTVLVSGSVDAAVQVELAFSQGGRLEDVLVNVGDTVALGQELARLDTRQLENAVKQAEADLATAQARYDATVAGATPEDVAIAKHQVDDAVRAYEDTQRSTETDLSSSERSLANARRDLEEAQRTTQADVAGALDSLERTKAEFSAARASFAALVTEIRADVAAYQDALGPARALIATTLGRMDQIQQTNDTDSARDDLQAAEVSLSSAETYAAGVLAAALDDLVARAADLTDAVAAFDAAVSAGTSTATAVSRYLSAEHAYALAAERLDAALDSPAGEVSGALTSATAAQRSLSTLDSLQRTVLDAPRAEVLDLQTRLTDMKLLASTVGTRIGQADASVATITNAVTGAYVSALESYAAATVKAAETVQAAEDAAASAEHGFAATRESTESSLGQRAGALRSAELSFAKTTGASAAADLASAYAGLLGAQVGLEKGRIDLEDATLRSTVAGVVAQVASRPGEFVSGGSATPFIVIAQTSALTLRGTIGEADVAQLRAGQAATVVVDAVGTTPLNGRVTLIDPIATIQQGVPVYGVDVLIEAPDPGIRPGMSGTASVVVASEEGVLTIPNLAIRSEAGRRFVQVLRDGAPQLARVRFGISDETVTQVVEGLSEGDLVVLPTPQTQQQGANRFGGPAPAGGQPGGSRRAP